MRWTLATAVAVLATACGSGGGGGGGGGGDAPTPVELVFVSGHFSLEAPATSSLDQPAKAGPFLIDALETAGYDVSASFFVDGDTEPQGLDDLVAHLRAIRDAAAARGGPVPAVIVVAHSHGGTRATAAVQAVPDLPIRMFVHLDTNSFAWTVVHDAADVAAIGGDPEGRFDLGIASSSVLFPAAPNEAGTTFDLEDVVFPSVQESLEVRTGDPAPVFPPFPVEPIDEHWNLRLDGTTTGLSQLFTGTTHGEVVLASGTTMPQVRDWILARLLADRGP